MDVVPQKGHRQKKVKGTLIKGENFPDKFPWQGY